MPRAGNISLADHLKNVPTEVRPTVKAAIAAVKKVAPRAGESTYRSSPPRSVRAMYKIVRFAVDGEYVVGIGTFPKHATMFFYRGRELDDGSGLLQGSGKDTRFITLHSPADAEKPAVTRTIRKAFKLVNAAEQRG